MPSKKTEIHARLKHKNDAHPRYGYLNGIAARDYTAEEYAELTDDERDQMVLSGLWTIQEDAPKEGDKAERKPAKEGDG